MKRNTKKGFTLTELIIVIVIIGILAAVLIPVLSSYIKKARMATEKEIVRNINMALKSDEVTIASGEKHKTMYDALQVAKSVGYDVAKINDTKYGNEILWDSKNDVFCYLNNGNIEYIPEYPGNDPVGPNEQYLYWSIMDQYNSSRGYSVYLLGDETISNNIVGVTTGIDVGENEVTGTIYYTREDADPSQTVIIRTNSFSSSLVIDAPNDTIKHYDKVGYVKVISVHEKSSFHESGKAAFIEVANGRIALENNSKVDQIHLNVTAGGFDNITISKASGVSMPDFSRDPVDLSSGSVMVVALQDGIEDITDQTNLEYIWLTEIGIFEQVTISHSKSDPGSSYVEEVANEEKIFAAKQIANNISVTIAEKSYTVTATKIEDNWVYKLLDEQKEESNDYEISGEPEISFVIGENSITTNVDVNIVSKYNNQLVIESNASVENGLDDEKKGETISSLVVKELINDSKDGDCQHNGTCNLISEIKLADCVEDGEGLYQCSLCGKLFVKTIPAYNHEGFLVGTYCNICHHPVAFIEEIDYFTVDDSRGDNAQQMSVRTTFEGLTELLISNTKTYLDVCYLFKTFKDADYSENIEEEMYKHVLDGEKLYILDIGSLTFTPLTETEIQTYQSSSESEDDSQMMVFTERSIFEAFGDWYCDFYVSFDETVAAYSCGLGGAYGEYISVGFLNPCNMNAGDELCLLGQMSSGGESNFTYYSIAQDVGEFICGFFNLMPENTGKTFTVTLRMLHPGTADHSYLYPVESELYPFNLPSYIDIAVTNYTIAAPSKNSLDMFLGCLIFDDNNDISLQKLNKLFDLETSSNPDLVNLKIFLDVAIANSYNGANELENSYKSEIMNVLSSIINSNSLEEQTKQRIVNNVEIFLNTYSNSKYSDKYHEIFDPIICANNEEQQQ